ncbi:MAG TPA: hypothetical protein VIM55_20770 [Mucilaginibacter sp.]
MKRLPAILCLSITLLCLVACSKKSEPPPVNKISIVGKWNEDSLKVVYSQNGNITDTHNESTSDGSYRQFNSDATGIDYFPQIGSFPSTTIQITYSVTGDKLDMNYPAFTYSGLTFPAETQHWTISMMTVHNLEIVFISSSTDENGVVTKGTQHWYFSR